MRWKSLVRFGRRVAETDQSKDWHRAAARPHTKLRGPQRGVYYDLYVLLDIFSRYVVGFTVAAREDAEIAAALIMQAVEVHGAPRSVHADRGTSMTSKPVAQLLLDLGVARSHSRPPIE